MTNNHMTFEPTMQAEEEMYQALIDYRQAQIRKEDPNTIRLLHLDFLHRHAKVETLEMARLNFDLN